MIYIRADANRNIGMGHIMRCLSIADAASVYDHNIVFIIARDDVRKLINDRGYSTFVLNTDYKNMEAELAFWPQVSSDFIIVDSYYVTDDYLKKLRNRSKLIYLDDILAFPYSVDVLVNYNAYANVAEYQELYKDIQIPLLILGPTYAPLRRMFRDVPQRNQASVIQDILVSTGGSDELHVAINLLRTIIAMKEQDMRRYHFLIGAMNTDKNEINRITANYGNLILHENVMDMKTLISSVDLVISAAGSTLYEICACGVPLITFSIADNQLLGAKAFEKLGLAINIGDLRDPYSIDAKLAMSGKLDAAAMERIIRAIDELSADYTRRVQMGTRMQYIVDGHGADRMIKEIISY